MKSLTGDPELDEALWAGDTDRLHELAWCRCCCDEHTFEDCPARLWYGCRGQGSMTRADLKSWEVHYAQFHGLSWHQFHGFGEEDIDGPNGYPLPR